MDPIIYTLGGGVITSLVGAVIFLFKKWDSERDKRLDDAKEARDKLTEPIQQIIDLSEKIYGSIPENKRNK